MRDEPWVIMNDDGTFRPIETPDQSLLALAKQVARPRARKCWWANAEDLIQVAALTAIEVAQSYAARNGGAKAPRGYLYRAAACQVTNELWRESSPVTLPSNMNFEGVRSTIGMHRAELSDTLSDGGDENVVDRLQKRHLRALIDKATADVPNAKLAVLVLFAGWKSSDLAAAKGIGIEDVYYATMMFKRAIARSEECRSAFVAMQQG